MKANAPINCLGAAVLQTLSRIAFAVVVVSSLSACLPEPGFQRDPNSLWPFSYVWSPGLSHPGRAHISAGAHEGQWEAEPGYQLGGQDGLTAEWSGGQRHPANPHIESAANEGQWLADPGYQFIQDRSLDVKWVAGLGHPKFPHIRSSADEGSWSTEPGYRFVDSTRSLATSWAPGYVHPTATNVLAGRNEGQWIAGPGYRFTATSALVAPVNQQDLSVEWIPGVRHPVCSTLVSGNEPARWIAAPGYLFVSKEDGQFDVVREASGSGSRMGEALASASVAVIASAVSEPASDDGVLMSIGKGLIRQIGKDFGRAAVDTVIDEVKRPAVANRVGEVITCDYWALER